MNARLVMAAAAAVSLLPGQPAAADSPYATLFIGPGQGSIAECPPWTLNLARPLAFRVFGLDRPAGGVKVAAGDVNGDGRADIIAACGSPEGGRVSIYDGVSRAALGAFLIDSTHFRGGINVAAGDVNGDGRADIITGAGPGGGPVVRIFSGNGFDQLADFSAYQSAFRGGVRVAAGDVNGDGTADIVTGPGPGGGSQVRVFTFPGLTELKNFTPYDSSFSGGVFVAAGDLNGDGRADVAVAPGPNSSDYKIKVRDGTAWSDGTPISAMDALFTIEQLAIGDLNGDGAKEVVYTQDDHAYAVDPVSGECAMSISIASGDSPADTSDAIAFGDVTGDGKPDLLTGSPFFSSVRIQSPDFAKRFTKFPLGNLFTGGFSTACGDLNGDGVYDMIMASGSGGGTDVKTCTGTNGGLIHAFNAFTVISPFGLNAAAGDVNGDGRDDIIVAPALGGGSQVKAFNSVGQGALHAFFAYDAAFTGGVRLAAADFNGDGVDDIVTAPGSGMPAQVKVFNGISLAVLRDFTAESAGFTGGVFVAAGDVNGDGVPDIVTGTGSGPPMVRIFNGRTSASLGSFLAYDAAFSGGVRVAVGDVDGDSAPEILCAPGPGAKPEVRGFAYPSFRRKFSFLPYPSTFTGGVFISSWTPAAPAMQMSGFQRLANGSLQFNLLCPKGRTAYMDYSADNIVWTTALSRGGTGANDLFTFTPPAGPRIFVRGRSQ